MYLYLSWDLHRMKRVLEWRHPCYRSEYQKESRSCQGRRSLSNQTGSCNKLVRNCWQRRKCAGTSWVLSHYQHCNKKRGKTPEREIQQLFLKRTLGDISCFFWGGRGLLILLFWTSGDIPSWVSEPRWIPWLECFVSCMQQIPQIHLWCDTCWPLGSRHGGWNPTTLFCNTVLKTNSCAKR